MKIQKYLLIPDRRRKIQGGFSFIPRKFLFDNYFYLLSKNELSLYFFLIISSDKDGISYYSYKKLCNILKIETQEYITARNLLIEKSLVAFDGTIYQVLSLPLKPIVSQKLLTCTDDFINHDPATIHHLCEISLTD